LVASAVQGDLRGPRVVISDSDAFKFIQFIEPELPTADLSSQEFISKAVEVARKARGSGGAT
jgi:hypothetical protein